jgi:cytochrome c
MDSFEINKILGALLFTCLCLLSLNIAAEAVFHPAKPAKPGYEVAATEPAAGDHGPAAKEPDEPIEKLLASATVEKGANAAKKCAACHTFGKGEPNRVGPNLYGVVGRPKATGGFDYSAALKGKGGNWTVEDLDKFLTNPKSFAPGTKMSFAGLPRGGERADVIAFLNSKADNPAPLPKAADAGPAAKPAEAPAAGAAAKPAEAPAGQKK